MRFSEKGILASLLLILIAFSTSAQTRIFEGVQTGSVVYSWESQVGLYLPFVLFTLISTYHFLDWAKKHRRQAIIISLLLFSVASLIGIGTANSTTPAINSMTAPHFTFTEQGQSAPVPIQAFPQIQQDVLKVQQALNSTPYYSFTANALLALITVAAIALLLLRTRSRGGIAVVPEKATPTETIQEIGGTPREAIIRYYLLACQALHANGMQIADSDTPSDIYLKTNSRTPSVAADLQGLTLLFQEAKFSLHKITEREAIDASSHWEQISSQMSGSVLS